ncbi:MAG: class SAM-dependent methyltransferase [Acidimicrobiales bacterium]|nr:class SAM-dependent methyltransferase [Acidimicrobiales bacterium]
MRPHPALDEEMVERLREQLGEPATPPPLPPPSETPPPPTGPTAQAKRIVKGAIRRGIAWYVDPVTQQTADRTADRVEQRVLPKLDELERLLERDDDPDVQSLAVNFELLKGEVRALRRTVEQLGWAIAPDAGLDGAGDRLSEFRARISAVERRARAAPSGEAPAAAPKESTPAATTPSSGGFDYVGFERRFRGDPALVLETMKERYLDVLRNNAPVLDVGCGRGELLAVLRDEGIPGVGVDLDSGMVAEAAELGLDVHEGDAVAFLRAQPEGSYGSIISTQVVEHLELEALLQLLELSAARLRPGGVFIAETPNPGALFVLGNSYAMDPTHVRPLHPALMAFLCEGAGFQHIEIRFFAPAEGYHLPLIDDPDAPEWASKINQAFIRLNDTIFGPQDYAVVAATAAL